MHKTAVTLFATCKYGIYISRILPFLSPAHRHAKQTPATTSPHGFRTSRSKTNLSSNFEGHVCLQPQSK
ncbi:hypothetical protein AAHA92_21523 [Salvia divinorum]|uniref:Uncharacterized protein n=1 Tax=Salvia divinorum TaxID=28513 RepID=A0ABD1GKQ4_SALDI